MRGSTNTMDEVVHHLRNRIIRGAIGPGDRFPTREELQDELGVSWSPIHRAFVQLKSEGFVVTNGKGGTLVAPNPPHLSRYALVFPRSEQESKFWQTLRAATERIARDEDRNITTFLLDQRDSISNLNHQLEEDIAAHRVAGLMLIWMDGQVADDSPLWTQSDMPRVLFFDCRNQWPSVGFDIQAFFATAIEHLLSAGRKRIAHLGFRKSAALEPLFGNQVRQRGLVCPAYFDQQIGRSSHEVATGIVHLLMSLPPEQRPDGLIISDDHLVEHVQTGLIDAGVRVGVDVSVVASCNYPISTPSVLPMARLGFDCSQLARAMIERIDQQRAGLTPEHLTLIPPQFEHEITKHAVLRPFAPMHS